MASWGDLVAFIRSEFRVVRDQPDEIRILVEFEDERGQVVIVQREVLDQREEWVQIASPCGLAAEVNIPALLVDLGNTAVVGGAVIMGEYVVLRHSIPLENLQANEFVDPMSLLAGLADEIEEKFTGGDAF